MATLEFRPPDVGEGIATAEIVAWQVREGDHVDEHQDLVEIQTDKATVVIPCPASGVVARLRGEEGDVVEVGAVLAVIEVANGDGDGAAAPPSRAAAPSRQQLPLAAPTTRRLARELGVALERVEGSGPHGRILREDVERAAAAPPSAPAARAAPATGDVIPLRGV